MLAQAQAKADFTISESPTQNVSCTNGNCSATAGSANLNVAQLHVLLAAADTTLQSGYASNIVFDASLRWSSGHALTVSASNTLSVNAPIVVAGPSQVTLATHYGPNYVVARSFGPHGRLDFLLPAASSLTINGAAFTLVSSLQELAAAVAAKS